MKCIFTAYIFSVINIDTFYYKFGQTSNTLTGNFSKWTLFAGLMEYGLCISIITRHAHT
jgi:hypothetical protein